MVLDYGELRGGVKVCPGSRGVLETWWLWGKIV